MEPGRPQDITIIGGITDAEQFGESLRQWSALVQHDARAARDEYDEHWHLAGCDPAMLLARITQRHAESPLLMGHQAREATVLKKLCGYGQRGDIWSKYSGMPRGDGTAAFSTIERAGAVLLFATYTLRVGDPSGEQAVDVVLHVVAYLSGWQHYIAALLFPQLRALVVGAASSKLAL